MNYKQANRELKQGKKITRKAWLESEENVVSGKTKVLMYVVGAEAPYRGIGRIKIEPFVAQYLLGREVYVYQPTNEDKEATDFRVLN